jgi:ROS/MUCR transcriptional regulator protein
MCADTAPAPNLIPLYGEIGVLAYDEVADRIQCHVCGQWLQKIESRHLALHNLTIPLYKELCGLNATTPLETPRITELRRRKNREHQGWRNLVADYRFKAGEPRSPRETRAQFRREHYNSNEQRRRGREWSDEEMLAFLREIRARHGGELRQEHLLQHRPGGRGIMPSRNAVIQRFGSWKRVCELLNQPYHIGRPRTSSAWSNRSYAYRTLVAAYQAALRTPRLSDGGHAVALAPSVVPGVERNPKLWTDGLAYRVYEDVEDGGGMEAAQPVPAVWRIAPEQEEVR